MSRIAKEARKLYALTEEGAYSKRAFDEQLKVLFTEIELENQCPPSTNTNPTNTPSS